MTFQTFHRRTNSRKRGNVSNIFWENIDKEDKLSIYLPFVSAISSKYWKFLMYHMRRPFTN